MSPIEELARSPYWRQPDAQQLVDAWQASGLPIARFAAQFGCSPLRLGRWARRLAGDAQPAFIELKVVEPTPAPIEVLVGGLVVRVPARFDPVALRRLVDVLAERC